MAEPGMQGKHRSARAAAIPVDVDDVPLAFDGLRSISLDRQLEAFRKLPHSVVLERLKAQTKDEERRVDAARSQLEKLLRREAEAGREYHQIAHKQASDILKARGPQVTSEDAADLNVALSKSLYRLVGFVEQEAHDAKQRFFRRVEEKRTKERKLMADPDDAKEGHSDGSWDEEVWKEEQDFHHDVDDDEEEEGTDRAEGSGAREGLAALTADGPPGTEGRRRKKPVRRRRYLLRPRRRSRVRR